MNTRVNLTLCSVPTLPVEAENLLPVTVTGKTRSEIEAMPLQVGNRTEKVGDRFQVEVTEGPDNGRQKDGLAELVLTGDLTRFKRLGESMAEGSMLADGPVGFHAGAQMSGGTLTVTGDTGDHLGAMMTGGRILVHGNAGHFAGSAYRGYTRGMAGGTIIIHGNAGNLTGARMRRGTIAVQGACGDLAGFGMGAGTIVIGGVPGARAGANMVRGSVILLTPPAAMPPTFRYNCTYRPGFWPLLLASLTKEDGVFTDTEPHTAFKRYSGDFNEGGRGEILLRHTTN